MSNKLPKRNQINNNQIIVDDGSRVYDIRNKRRELLGQFTFVPSDMGVIERYEHAAAVFEGLQEKLSLKDSDVDVMQVKKEAEEEIKNEIDYLFNSDASGTFFKNKSPFTPLETGEFYVENVMNAVKLIIESETGRRLSKAKSRASKYTEKYHK